MVHTAPENISGNSKGMITRPDTRVNTILKHNKKLKIIFIVIINYIYDNKI